MVHGKVTSLPLRALLTSTLMADQLRQSVQHRTLCCYERDVGNVGNLGSHSDMQSTLWTGAEITRETNVKR